MSKIKDVAIKAEEVNLPVLAERPAYLTQTAGVMPRGSEEVKSDDLIIPRLEIVQSLSPVRNKNDAAYIEGAEEGMIFNTVTRELYGQQVLIVPALFRKEYLIWKDRNQGGGFRGAFPDEGAAGRALAELGDKQFCEIADTAQHFCLLLRANSERADEVVVSMSRTKLKVSRNWNSLIRLAGDDRFSRVYMLETVPETNSKNQSYFNWKVTALGYAPEYAYRAGERLYESVQKGRIIEADRSFDEPATADSKEI